MATFVARRAFRNQSNAPLGSEYVFWAEDGSTIVRSYDKSVYMRALQIHLESTFGKPFSYQEVWAAAMDNMCRRLPKGFCTGGDPDKAGVTVPELRKNTEKLFGKPNATPGEIVERLAVCTSCPKHDRSICTSCDGLSAWAVRGVRRSKIPADSFAGVCLVDRVFVSALVSVLQPPDTRDRPTKCWRSSNG
jgi:hypothetical protein